MIVWTGAERDTKPAKQNLVCGEATQNTGKDGWTPMACGMVDLERLLNYELRSSVRYRRFLSMVMVACTSSLGTRERLASNELLHDSDELFEIEGGYSIVMGETDKAGALTAVERLKSHWKEEGDLRFAVVSFPVDGHIAAELLTSAHRRLNKAKGLHPGAVVATG